MFGVLVGVAVLVAGAAVLVGTGWVSSGVSVGVGILLFTYINPTADAVDRI